MTLEKKSLSAQQPDNPDKKVVPISLDGVLSDLNEAIANRKKWVEIERVSNLEKQREDTRSFYGKLVIQTFCAIVALFAFTGCLTLFFSDGSKLKPLIEFIQAVGSIITPIVGFIVGHYFASKESK